MVTNGDFSTGDNTGVGSDYAYKQDVPGLVPAGKGELYDASGNNAYSITTNGQNVHVNFWGQDHTKNATGTRGFMAVNGHGNTLVVWRENNVTVKPSTVYYFSAWAMSLNSGSSFAKLQFSVNGFPVGNPAVLASHCEKCVTGGPNDNWVKFWGTWTSDAATTANIAINDLQGAGGGNDFGLDDISFGTLTPAPSTLISPPGTDLQTVCINTPITNILYSTQLATGASATGLPPGVLFTFSSNVATISGIPTTTGTYNYTITFTSSCSSPFTKTGTIIVTQVPVIANKTATICSGSAFSVTPVNGTDIVPAGTTYSWSTPLVTGGMTGGSAGLNASAITGTLVNPTSISQTAIYTVTPTVPGPPSCPAAPFTVTVTVNPTASIASVTGTNTLCIGGTTTFTANSVVLSGGTGTWSASNANASVDATGKVTANSAGTCDITYTITDGCGAAPVSKFRALTINPNVSAGTISGTTSLCIGTTSTYTSDGNAGGSWSSSNTATATINSSSGVLTAVGAGSTDIKYTVSSGCGSPVSIFKTITVAPDVSPFTVSGASPLCPGATTTYTHTSINGGTWTSSNTSIATVDDSGNVTTVRSGSCNISYTITGPGACGSTISEYQAIVVNPNASIASVTATICSGTGFTVTPTDGINGIVPAGTTYSWSAPGGTGFTGGASGSGASSISGTLTNTTTATVTATYTVTPLSGSCTGTPFTVTVTIYPLPTPSPIYHN